LEGDRPLHAGLEPSIQQHSHWVHSAKYSDFAAGTTRWFEDGTLNACYNCVDRHALKDPTKLAIIYEGDELHDARCVTFGELMRHVQHMAAAYLSLGLKTGDCVAIYMPMIPEAAYAMLACARLGIIHK
jgi:acetyl-CoA synthetase